MQNIVYHFSSINMYPSNMKLILKCSLLTTILLLLSCANTSTVDYRSPANILTKMAEAKAEGSASSAIKPIDLFLKYILIKNTNFEIVGPKDCKAFAQRNEIFCETPECRAILSEQDQQCKDNVCRAFITNREDLCPDGTCRALVTTLPEKCDRNDATCLAVLNKEDATCPTDDCKGLVKDTAAVCKSKQCKAIVSENSNFCL